MTKHLTYDEFKDQIFDLENETEWKYKGDKPAIIDFYADWCGPCKMIAPILEKLAEEYKNKVEIIKINTEEEHKLAAAFGIRSIPSLLFVPMNEEPQMAMGALPEETFRKVIKETLKVE